MDGKIRAELKRRLTQDLGEELTTKVMAHLIWALDAERCNCECGCSGFYCNLLYPDGNEQRLMEERLARGTAILEENFQEGQEYPEGLVLIDILKRDEYGQLRFVRYERARERN